MAAHATRRSAENVSADASMGSGLSLGTNAPRRPVSLAAANLPRTMRARIFAVRQLLRHKRKPVSPQSPPSPNQEAAVNPRTGKVAFGPWLGPFSSNLDAEPEPPMLFMDVRGNTFAKLEEAAAKPPQKQLELVASRQIAQQAVRKAHDKCSLYTKQHSAGCSRVRMAINQPRNAH